MSRTTQRYHRRTTSPASAPHPAVERIDAITTAARSIWFGLMSYLAFVGITWMGVTDPDFFLPQRETQLPLIGVSVPTLLFFSVAPALGALIYAYFHMQLLKLWEALASAPARIDGLRLSEAIRPWLISDLCLSYRTDGALRPRPLARTSHWVNFIFVFLGTPFVLFSLWLTSAIPHDDLLTMLFCGVPLSFALFVGMSSFHRMRRLARHRSTRVSGRGALFWCITAALWLAILGVGFLRVEGTLKYYATELNFVEEDEIAGTWLDWEVLSFLPRANLANVNFDGTPLDWPDRQTFRLEYRATWCQREGLPGPVCGPATDLDDDNAIRPRTELARARYCRAREWDKPACTEYFADYETTFEAAWKTQRRRDRAAHKALNLSRKDLRRANLSGARMEGAILSRARMEGANLSWARMEGAFLSEARMEGAFLREARMEGAFLRGARMEGANLFGARMEGAFLVGARMEGANLRGVRMEGANFFGARMEGANLSDARMDENTDLSGATLRGAALRSVDDTTIARLKPFWQDIFADGTVTVPQGDRPAHWPAEALDYWGLIEATRDFHQAWRKWQRSIGMDPDTPS